MCVQLPLRMTTDGSDFFILFLQGQDEHCSQPVTAFHCTHPGCISAGPSLLQFLELIGGGMSRVWEAGVTSEGTWAGSESAS